MSDELIEKVAKAIYDGMIQAADHPHIGEFRGIMGQTHQIWL